MSPQQCKDWFHQLLVGDGSLDFRSMHCEGHIVVVEERMRALLASGRAHENDYCFLFGLGDDGRIARVREHMDTRRARECLFGQEGGA